MSKISNEDLKKFIANSKGYESPRWLYVTPQARRDLVAFYKSMPWYYRFWTQLIRVLTGKGILR